MRRVASSTTTTASPTNRLEFPGAPSIRPFRPLPIIIERTHDDHGHELAARPGPAAPHSALYQPGGQTTRTKVNPQSQSGRGGRSQTRGVESSAAQRVRPRPQAGRAAAPQRRRNAKPRSAPQNSADRPAPCRRGRHGARLGAPTLPVNPRRRPHPPAPAHPSGRRLPIWRLLRTQSGLSYTSNDLSARGVGPRGGAGRPGRAKG